MASNKELKIGSGKTVQVKKGGDSLDIVINAQSHPIRAVPDKVTPVSPFGILNDARIAQDKVYVLTFTDNDTLWAVLRGIWHAFSQNEYIAIERPQEPNCSYITQTGLGFESPVDRTVLILAREAFWQGAGAPTALHWLHSPVPSVDFSPLSTFPQIQSFTKNELVATVHPLRPPKPAPGTVFYARYVPAVGQTLSFVHIDGANSEHFEHYKKWQNSDRVNVGWREKGPDEKHHQYIRDRLEDKHMMGFIFSWDGHPAGYGELAWVMEDPINVYCGGMDAFDQGIHLLVGEEHFRGKERCTLCLSMVC